MQNSTGKTLLNAKSYQSINFKINNVDKMILTSAGNFGIGTTSPTEKFDVVGSITRGGEWDDEGNVITEPTSLDGFHVNYVGELPEGWEAFEVTPNSPYRVFA